MIFPTKRTRRGPCSALRSAISSSEGPGPSLSPPGRAITLAAAAGRYLRVTCPDVDDPGRRAVCERVVASLAVAEAPGGAR